MQHFATAIAGRFRLDKEHQCLRGWICDQQDPQASQWIDILVGNQVVASIEACLPRGDLQYLDTGYVNYGFEYLFPDGPMETRETKALCVRHRDTGVALQGNAAEFRRRSVFSQSLDVCGLGDLKHYEVSNVTQVVPIDSHTWSGDPAFESRLLGLHPQWSNHAVRMQQTPDGVWQYQKMIRNYRFPDATVIMPFGIVIVDRHVVRPSLVLLNPDLVKPVLSRSDSAPYESALLQHRTPSGESLMASQYRLRMVAESVQSIEEPAFLMSTPGYNGYFHWHVDILPLISCADHFSNSGPRQILCAKGSSSWQRDSLQLLKETYPQYAFRVYGELRILRVKELLYSSGLGGRGAFLSPDILSFYDKVLARCPESGVPDGIGKRLYLSRKTHLRRPMSNEAEIEELVRSLGFSVIDPADFSYRQQIAIFRHAETVISPHGAGLANLLFCSDGVKVIELFGDAYMSRSLQRVANLKKARYGYLVGKSTRLPDAKSRHDFCYEIAPQQLASMIKLLDS